ncbi:MAG TPA: hypothetical protein PLD88_01845 [Candidatus Berkiella sp.]|nr:hypothetical protein [Candidatus Berkiella sp.]
MLTAYQHQTAIEQSFLLTANPPISYEYDERAAYTHDFALTEALAEMDKRRTNFGYGLGVFIGRLIGARDKDFYSTNKPIVL